MIDADAGMLRRRAVAAATRKGFREPEDLAHDWLVLLLRGKGKHQTADQGVKDAARNAYGRDFKRALKVTPITLKNAGSAPPGVADDFQNTLDRFDIFDRTERCMMVLAYRWDFTHEEIGDALGYTGNTVAQMMVGIKKKVRATLLLSDRVP